MLFTRKLNITKLCYPLLVLLLANCSTQLEDRASVDFEPNIPVGSKKVNKDKYGSIYSNSQKGLFATDRRASKVGDILTVSLSENFSASKSQSAKSAKKGELKFDFPNVMTAGADDGLFDSSSDQSFDARRRDTSGRDCSTPRSRWD